MPTARAFAYNTSQQPPTGATQVGNLAIESTGWQHNLGNLTWYNGCDEDLGYVIGYPTTGLRTWGSQAGTVSGTAFGFLRSSSLTENSFLQLTNDVLGTSFATGSVAAQHLNSIGWWTSYSTASSQLILDNMTLRLDAGLTSSYPGSGLTWFDIAGTQENISLVNSPTYTLGSPSYFSFNPASSQRGTGTGTGVVPQSQYTKSVWFWLNTLSADNNLVSSQLGGHFMYFAGSDKVYAGHANWGNYALFSSTATFSINQWYNVTVTFNTSDGMKIYINGALDSSYNGDLNPHNGNTSTNIAHFGGGNFLNGRISKVYCWGVSLDLYQVAQNYNYDCALFGLPTYDPNQFT